MAKLAEKIFPEEELREKVTIRVLPQKMQIYPRFKELVTEQLGSDVCFVTTSLWEAFLNAMDQNPPASEDPIEMKFMRQNVQINIGCQILYQPTKARRYPPVKPETGFPFYIKKEKNLLLPEFLDQWKTMSENSKLFWLQRFQDAGIVPAQQPQKKARKPRSDKGKPRGKRKPLPSISTPASKTHFNNFFKSLNQSMTNVSRRLRRALRRK